MCVHIHSGVGPPGNRAQVILGALDVAMVCIVVNVEEYVVAQVMIHVVASITSVCDRGIFGDADICSTWDYWYQDAGTIGFGGVAVMSACGRRCGVKKCLIACTWWNNGEEPGIDPTAY